MCIVTPVRAFYYETEDSKYESQTTQMLFEWMMKRVDNMVEDKGWWRFNLFITDTCNTMRAVWSLVEYNSQTKHVFCITSNSHGLLLLIHDLLDIEPFQPCLKKLKRLLGFSNLRSFSLPYYIDINIIILEDLELSFLRSQLGRVLKLGYLVLS